MKLLLTFVVGIVLLNGCCTDAKAVFAHFMMGNSYGYNQQSFQNDMSIAKSLGIDAFALNIGVTDWMWDRTYKAYLAAGAVGFKVFLSFDMSNSFASGDIVNWVRNFGNGTYPGQFMYNNQIFVSTFGGESNTLGQATINAGWQNVKTTLYNQFKLSIYFAPEWSGLNANSVYQNNPVMDAFFSWNAWPGPTENAATLMSVDGIYMSTKGSKQYMAPVSPYFYAHLSYKNYLYKTETLWIDRWNTLLKTQPDFIEIITWNDWGESHYIGPIDPNQGDWPGGSAMYVNGMLHEAFRDILPAYISAYKNGHPTPDVSSDVVVYWHRPYFVDGTNCADGIGTPTVQNRDTSPSSYKLDQVIGNQFYVAALLTSPAQLSLVNTANATNARTYSLSAGANIVSDFVVTSTGKVQITLTRNGSSRTTTDGLGMAATGSVCNYNVYVGRL